MNIEKKKLFDIKLHSTLLQLFKDASNISDIHLIYSYKYMFKFILFSLNIRNILINRKFIKNQTDELYNYIIWKMNLFKDITFQIKDHYNI